MPNLARSKTQIDLTSLAFRMAHALDELGLSYTQVTALTGVTRRQISDAAHARPISAGATFMLCHLCSIPMDELLPVEARLQFLEIQKVKQDQPVTLDVPRETVLQTGGPDG